MFAWLKRPPVPPNTSSDPMERMSDRREPRRLLPVRSVEADREDLARGLGVMRDTDRGAA